MKVFGLLLVSAFSALASAEPLRVFYDGACHLCRWEMEEVYRPKAGTQIEFIDITDPMFDASAYNLDLEAAKKLLHAETVDGRVYGVQAFQEIWRRLDSRVFNRMAVLADSPTFCKVLDGAYQCFLKLRPYLPRSERLPPACHDGVCDLSARYSKCADQIDKK